MKVVGVTGRIGSGKSTLCRLLAERHACTVIDADRLGHAALRDPVIRGRVVDRFGETILDAGGEIDRAAVARRVFDDPEALRDLEAWTHPWIVGRILERLAALQGADPAAIVLVDAALLLPWIERLPLDEVVWVRASDRASIERLELRGIGEQEARRRLERQRPEEDFRRRATVIVENSGGLEELATEADRLWDSLLNG
jgi:dephospho-CoA kinase